METQNNDNIILIENYLDGKLSEDEEKRFLRQLESDSELAKLYRFRLKIKNDWQKARQYKETRQQVIHAVRKAKSHKKRKVIYAVAASLALLVIVSEVFIIVNQRSFQIVSTESNSTQMETYQPQLKEPESYANSGRYNPEAETNELFLSFTVENDSLVFSWHPITSGKSDLVVISQESENELFRKQIKLSTSKVALPVNQLPAGKMIWFIDGFIARDSFQLAEIY